MKSSHLVIAVGALGIATTSTHAAADGTAVLKLSPAVAQNVDAFDRGGDHVAVHAQVHPISVKLRQALDADPRFLPLAKEIREAAALKDRRLRKAKIDGLAGRIVALRSEVIKKSAIERGPLEKMTTPLTHLLGGIPIKPIPPGGVITTKTFSSLPDTFTYKHKCPDSVDTWDFSGSSKVSVFAKSTIADEDCASLKAGRIVTVHVPLAASRMSITYTGTFDLDVGAISLGAYAHSSTDFGIRVYSPDGGILLSKVDGNMIPAAFLKIGSAKATNIGTTPIPCDFGSDSGNLQEGDARATVSIDLPMDRSSSTLQIMPIVTGVADADLTGDTWVSSDMNPTGLKVTFYK